MAVKYANTNQGTFDKSPSNFGGGRFNHVEGIATVAAADGDGDIYAIGVVNGNDRPTQIRIETTAITAGTDYELGLYLVNADGTLGAAVDIDLLMGSQTMASASNALNGFSAPAVANRGKTLHELLAAASITVNADKPQYWLALTANTVGTADGAIRVCYDALKDA